MLVGLKPDRVETKSKLNDAHRIMVDVNPTDQLAPHSTLLDIGPTLFDMHLTLVQFNPHMIACCAILL